MAHRGHAARYPENSLAAIEAAAAAGVHLIEFDIQLGKDGTPVLMHDETLARTTGRDDRVFDLTAAELQTIELQADGADSADGVHIPTLSQAVALLAGHPEWTYFIEIKRHSLEQFGVDAVVDAVLAEIAACSQQCVIISFDHRCLEAVQQRADVRTGWVLKAMSKATRMQAEALRPEYLLINYHRLLDNVPWPGDWQWVCYEIIEAAHAQSLQAQGIDIISSMAAPELQAAMLEAGLMETASRETKR